jgi:hypothetical protein
MRFIALVLAAIAVASPSVAQGWKEYAYPGDGFTVAFPAEPSVETIVYQAPDGRQVAARVYSVAQDGGAFRMMVADFTGPDVPESAVMEQAIKALTHEREVKVDIPHRIGRFYGRQLSTAGADGSRATVALFYHKQRLYQIEGKAQDSDATADAIRFQQSLTFTD